MKFKTKLQITFVSIILFPLILMALAFMLIGLHLMGVQQDIRQGRLDYTMISKEIEDFAQATDRAYTLLTEQAKRDMTQFEDVGYWSRLNEEVSATATWLLVRKDNEIYYAGNASGAQMIFESLPPYSAEPSAGERGFYFSKLECFAKQFDFRFADGSAGSAFVCTRVRSLISRRLLTDMIVAVTVILVVTSMVLTRWIQKGVFRPVNELNVAMKKIKEGNFDYSLETNIKGEIGDLYANYEDMRLRLKESAEEKAQQEQRNKELVSNISHDLKTPITAIKGYVEGIMDGVADTPEKMDKYIKTIYNKANDMDRLINELTVYSVIDNNRIPYNFHRINVAEYFGDCVEEVGLDLESKNIELNYSNMVPEDTMVIADPEQMKKVINNIISNSVKYMDKPHGVIGIRILDEGEAIRIEIEDNGRGVAAKDLQMIFERFYRTDVSRNSAQGGSGIGLSIVKKIIEDHGGYIWATGKEGEGICIHFVIRKYIELQV